MKRKQLLTTEDAKPATSQHKKPCSDCPWSRASLKGWLGGESVGNWLREAHSDNEIPCHVHTGAQCAGSAIYRRNVLKSPRDKRVLTLPPDKQSVFATPTEFRQHHEGKP